MDHVAGAKSTGNIEKRSRRSKKVFVVGAVIIAALGIGASAYLFVQHRNDQRIINNPSLAGQLEAENLVKKISVLMLLPTDEQPTVATVSDYEQLKDQAFFKNANNGDKVLIYTKAKIAILYDPQTNKILAVAPLNIGDTGLDKPPKNN